MAVKKGPVAPKYVRGMLTLEAIDSFFEILAWEKTPEEAREYEEPGPAIPECLMLIQKLHEDDQPPAAPTAPAAAPTPAPQQAPQQQHAAKSPEDDAKDGYDAGWHHKHRNQPDQPPAGHSDVYNKAFHDGYAHGGHAMSISQSLSKGDPESLKTANQAAGQIVFHKSHYDPLAAFLTGPALRRGMPQGDPDLDHPHQPGRDVLHDFAAHEGKGVGYSPAARDISHFYDAVEKPHENPPKPGLRPSELSTHLKKSAFNYLKQYARKTRGGSSATGVRHADEPAEPTAEPTATPGTAKAQSPTGRPLRAASRPTRVMTGAPSDPDSKGPIDTAPAKEPDENEPTPEKMNDVHAAMHDVIGNHPEFESGQGEFDRRAFLRHYVSGEHKNPAEILRKMGYSGTGPEKNMPNLILRGINSRGKQVGKGFHGIMREHPVSAALNAKPEESFVSFAARLYGLSLDESKGWLNDEAAHDLYGRWLIRQARRGK